MPYLNENVLYKPESPVQPAIDMFFCTKNKSASSRTVTLNIVLVQVTLAKKHPVKSENLSPIVAHLREKAGKQAVKWSFLYFVGRSNYFEPSSNEIQVVVAKSVGKKKQQMTVKIPVYVTSMWLPADYLIR